MDKDQLAAAIGSLPGEKVTAAEMEKRIASVEFLRLNTVTICSITLDNGYSVRGESACVDPLNYDEDIGQKLARDRAFDALWPLFGFLLAETRWLRKTAPLAEPVSPGKGKK